MQRRLAYLPLHPGKAPSHLFQRMVLLAGAITMAVVDEYGAAEMLRRLADPWLFQSFGCVLGFDWHSQLTLNMVAAEVEPNRKACADLIHQNPEQLLKVVEAHTLGPNLFAPTHHPVLPDDVNLARLDKVIRSAHETHPKDYEALLGTSNVGPATVRSLALIAELIYGTPISTRDLSSSQVEDSSERKWADYSYAHGGKDGYPFPVDRSDRNIEVLSEAVRKARLGELDKCEALKRLAKITE